MRNVSEEAYKSCYRHSKNKSKLFSLSKKYISCSKYSNVIGKDFWNTFDESAQRANKVRNLPANLTLTAIMETWENQAGFPVLNVTRFYSFPYIKLSQVLS